ncbi:MAG TPA: SDR family NAD(P)-dependent oxidoreductase [Methylocella sp.]|nr:SDR family NAD(P)-dependent oxidoreductase [Methylocella sp.]
MAATILITGANRGLGFEFARQYAADGWKVVAACRNPATASDLKQLAQDRMGRLTVVAMDVTDAGSVKDAATQLKDVAIDYSSTARGPPVGRDRRPAMSITNPGPMSST